MKTSRLEAPMTLIAVCAEFQIGACRDIKMLHGLAYHHSVADAQGIKEYAKELCDEYIRTTLVDKADPDDQITFRMIEYGAVVPDDISLPFGRGDTKKAALINMQMVVELTDPIAGVPAGFEGIKEAAE